MLCSQSNHIHRNPNEVRQRADSVQYTHQKTPLLPRGKGRKITRSDLVDSTYCVRPRSFFREGRVIAVIMNETAGENALDYTTASSINSVKFKNNYVHTSVRRLVVVRSKSEFCFACPIFTYSERGTTKGGVRPWEHGIIYSSGCSAKLLPGETGITKPSLSADMAEGVPDLHEASRIYYGIHHPVQYNIKVKDIGRIPREQIPVLIKNWRAEDENKDRQSADVHQTISYHGGQVAGAQQAIVEEHDSDDDGEYVVERSTQYYQEEAEDPSGPSTNG